MSVLSGGRHRDSDRGVVPDWQGRWLLGQSLPFELAAGCLLHCWRASNGLLCSAYPFRTTLGRCIMPGLVVSGRLSAMCPIDLETLPFLGQPVTRFLPWACRRVGWFCMTTPPCTFSCIVHSRLPDRFCSPDQQFRFFFPLSTRVYQAHAEGRGCLPFTREAGVDAIPLPQYHLPAWICSYENQNDFRRSASTLTDSFERTGRTHGRPADSRSASLHASG